MQSLLQTKEWATLRQGFGWRAHNIDGIWILERQLPMGKSFLYAPEVTWSQVIASLAKQSDGIASSLTAPRNDKVIFFRLEILDEFDEKIVSKLKENGFIKAFEELQPEWRQIIDISKSEDEILAQMKEKGRYNIRIAQRNNIEVKVVDRLSTSLEVEKFYRIFQETAKRDGFSIRPRKYFEKMFEILSNNVELLVAQYQDKIIAAEIVSYYDVTASYLYGASSSEHRNVMAPYLLHWEAIKRAKEKGCKCYDLLAVDPPSHPERGEGSLANASPETSSEIPRSARNDNHKYAGIGRFKRQFGGRTVHIVGSYDLVYKPTWYKLFKIVEKMRRK